MNLFVLSPLKTCIVVVVVVSSIPAALGHYKTQHKNPLSHRRTNPRDDRVTLCGLFGDQNERGTVFVCDTGSVVNLLFKCFSQAHP